MTDNAVCDNTTENSRIYSTANYCKRKRMYSNSKWCMMFDFKRIIKMHDDHDNSISDMYDIELMKINYKPVAVCLLNKKAQFIQVFVRKSERRKGYGSVVLNKVLDRNKNLDNIWGSNLSANNGKIFEKAGIRSIDWDWDLVGELYD